MIDGNICSVHSTCAVSDFTFIGDACLLLGLVGSEGVTWRSCEVERPILEFVLGPAEPVGVQGGLRDPEGVPRARERLLGDDDSEFAALRRPVCAPPEPLIVPFSLGAV